MKYILLIAIAFSICQAAKLYDCGVANKAIQFADTIQLYGLDQFHQLEFRALGNSLSAIQTDYIEIRVYGDEPEFKTLASRRFSYSSSSYSKGAQLTITDYAEFRGLSMGTYKVQIQVYDLNENRLIGCAAFYATQDQLQIQQ